MGTHGGGSAPWHDLKSQKLNNLPSDFDHVQTIPRRSLNKNGGEKEIAAESAVIIHLAVLEQPSSICLNTFSHRDNILEVLGSNTSKSVSIVAAEMAAHRFEAAGK